MKLYLLISISFFCSLVASAQIQAIGNTDESITKYPTHPDQHPVFLYSDIASNGLVVIPEDIPAIPNYVWYVYESGTWTQKLAGNSLEFYDIDDGGYKVEVKDAGIITETYYCWTFEPEIQSLSIDSTSTNCSNVFMASDIGEKTLSYYDLTSGDAINLTYNYDYVWEASPEEDLSTKNEPNPALPAPIETTSYSLSLDAFNNTSSMKSNSLEINGYAVKAEYVATITERGYDNEITSADSYSAPVLVNYEDKSLGNVTDREWIFYDTMLEEPENIVGADYDLTRPNFVFNNFGTYNTQLTVLNRDSGCRSSYEGEDLKVIEMFIDVPNAFTPNDDGVHDEFLVQYKSIKDFRMVIYNRWGRKVYQTTNPGEGWDGRIGRKRASEGVYIYYITAVGYNEGESKKLEGSIHLIR